MSLLESAYEDIILYSKVTVPDGYGGVKTKWEASATIQGAIVMDTSSQSRIAKQMGSTEIYTLIVHKEVMLDYHDVIKRVSDGQVFRLTSDTDDKKTPATATLNMREYTMEEWVIPT